MPVKHPPPRPRLPIARLPRGGSLGSLSGSVFGDDTLGVQAPVPDVPSVASVTPPSSPSSSGPSLFDKIGGGLATFFNTAAKAGQPMNTGIVPPGFRPPQSGMSPLTKIALAGGAVALVLFIAKRR